MKNTMKKYQKNARSNQVKTSKKRGKRGISARSGIKRSGPGGPKLIQNALKDGSQEFSGKHIGIH